MTFCLIVWFVLANRKFEKPLVAETQFAKTLPLPPAGQVTTCGVVHYMNEPGLKDGSHRHKIRFGTYHFNVEWYGAAEL